MWTSRIEKTLIQSGKVEVLTIWAGEYSVCNLLLRKLFFYVLIFSYINDVSKNSLHISTYLPIYLHGFLSDEQIFVD